MVSHQFLGNPADGARTQIIQDLWGLKQVDLARELRHTDDGRLVRYWQSKKKPKSPGQDSLEAIEARFDFTPIFFNPRREPPSAQPLFHKLSEANSAAAKRARGILQLVAEVADSMSDSLEPASIPTLANLSAVGAAQEVRRTLGLGQKPVPNLVRLLEQHGVAVALAPLDVRSVYSYGDRVLGRPVVITNARSGDRYESRFWGAHEVGHIVLHPRGDSVREKHHSTLEREASEFAAEFLTPASAMVASAQIIRSGRHAQWGSADDIPWREIADLKEHWGVEMSSILRRMRDVEVISPQEYALAIFEHGKLSANFRRRMKRETKDQPIPVWASFREPGKYTKIESPTRLQSAIGKFALDNGESHLSERLGIPQRFIDAIASETPVALDLWLSSSD